MHTSLFSSILAVMGFIFGGFILSRFTRRNDVADPLWGLGFIGIAFANIPGPTQDLPYISKIVLTFTILWGGRLSLYLWIRLLGKKEDPRYAAWRKEWGKIEPIRAFFQIFLLQGILLGIIALPLIWVLRTPNTQIGPWSFLGTCLFLVGFTLETIADAQMYQFKRSPKNRGKILTSGLWAYARHPNYLGEILIWWGFFSFALDCASGYLTLISPLLITFLLVKVSGVPMLEKLLEKRNREFSAYRNQTPALIPFNSKAILSFVLTLVVLVALDGVWLGIFMRPFYTHQLISLARIENGQWDTLLWAALGVYVFLAAGVQYFAIHASPTRLEACWRGAIFGLCTYAVYEFTNLALVRQWPLEMALIDICWGTFLCSAAATVLFRFRQGRD